MPDAESHSSRNTKRSENEAEGHSLLALLVCFTEMAFMFPAFHTVRSSGLAADGLGAMTGSVIPGAARQDKKEKEKQKRRLQTYGTYTARNVMREQHELG